ncbi:MAG: acyl-CoA dehydrogenase, partial [Pseudomonadota bacterium]
RGAVLTPIAKAYGTETGVWAADTGIQVHGGMGYVEETGAAQYLRDVRVTAIYEGTNGVQAMDLVGRKLADGGEAAFALLDEVGAAAETARPAFPDMAAKLWSASEDMREATEWMVAQQPGSRFAGAVAYLEAFALVLGAHYHLASAKAAANGSAEPRTALASAFIHRLLPRQAGLLAEATHGVGDLEAVSDEALGL